MLFLFSLQIVVESRTLFCYCCHLIDRRFWSELRFIKCKSKECLWFSEPLIRRKKNIWYSNVSLWQIWYGSLFYHRTFQLGSTTCNAKQQPGTRISDNFTWVLVSLRLPLLNLVFNFVASYFVPLLCSCFSFLLRFVHLCDRDVAFEISRSITSRLEC